MDKLLNLFNLSKILNHKRFDELFKKTVSQLNHLKKCYGLLSNPTNKPNYVLCTRWLNQDFQKMYSVLSDNNKSITIILHQYNSFILKILSWLFQTFSWCKLHWWFISHKSINMKEPGKTIFNSNLLVLVHLFIKI
jgi:hypothetical protein